MPDVRGLQRVLLATAFAGLPLFGQQTTKELTARELFYIPAAAPAAKPAAKTVEAVKPSARPPATLAATKPVKPPHTTPITRPSTPAAAPDGTAIMNTAAIVRKSAPAPAAGPPLGLRYTITKLVDGKMVEVAPDSAFQSGDKIRINVVPNSPGYLYIIQQGSSGTWSVLFPSSEVDQGDNHVQGFRDYLLPPKARMIFDAQAGVEKLFVVLAREPEHDLEQMIYSLQSPGKARPAADPAAPPSAAPKTLVAANISTDVVDRMRQVYARDLVVEQVTDETPGERKEQAVYVVNPTGSAESRVVADISLVHQ